LTEKHPFVTRTILKKGLDVLPAKRLPGKKSSLLLAHKVVSQARDKEIFLVSELGVQPRFIHTCGSFQFLEAGVGEPVFQKTGIAFSSTSSRLKLFGRPNESNGLKFWRERRGFVPAGCLPQSSNLFERRCQLDQSEAMLAFPLTFLGRRCLEPSIRMACLDIDVTISPLQPSGIVAPTPKSSRRR
jgi:hypothetical protein